MSEFSFTGTEADLPSDCYKIVSVSRNSKYFYLNQSSNSYNIPGTYSIENGSIIINGENGGAYTVKHKCCQKEKGNRDKDNGHYEEYGK